MARRKGVEGGEGGVGGEGKQNSGNDRRLCFRYIPVLSFILCLFAGSKNSHIYSRAAN